MVAAFGWHVQRVNGNDMKAVLSAFDTARHLTENKPRVLLIDTRPVRDLSFPELRLLIDYFEAENSAKVTPYAVRYYGLLADTLGPLIVIATLGMGGAILAEAALSFLGLGITPPRASLGNLVADGRAYLQTAWWISTMPGLALVLVAISLHLFSDGVREQLEPGNRV